MNNRWFIALLLLLVAAGALFFRLPRLHERPVHGDEAIHFEKFRILWEEKVYVYDPHEYHGPTHYYATFPAVWLTKPAGFAQTDEFTYRIVTVGFGVLLILLLPLIADGIGRWPAVVAGVLTAISPAMVFYSRYYIQEVPLIVFTLLAIGGAWRFLRSGNFLWAIVAGLGIGLMHSTKETWVIAGFCMAVALMGTFIWTALVDGRGTVTLGRKDLFAVLLGLMAATGVVVVVLSGTFTNWRGPLDSILTYTTYLSRGTGNTDHVNPWDFYLRILLFWQYGNNEPLFQAWRSGGRIAPVFTEAFIAVLALVGIVASMWRAPRAGQASSEQEAFLLASRQGPPSLEYRSVPKNAPAAASVDEPLSANPRFLGRFLAFYTVLMVVIYSIIPYKTPWCMLGFLHGLILLAGIGVVAIIRLAPNVPVKIVVALLLAAGAGHLGWQAWRMNYGVDRHKTPMAASHFNPHVYGHPSTKMFDLINRIREMEQFAPAGRKLQVRVATLDAWPLPWYLRDAGNHQIGYWPDAASIPDAAMDADLFITKPDMQDQLEERMKGEYVSEYFGLRKGVPLLLYVNKPVWDKFIETRVKPTK